MRKTRVKRNRPKPKPKPKSVLPDNQDDRKWLERAYWGGHALGRKQVIPDIETMMAHWCQWLTLTSYVVESRWDLYIRLANRYVTGYAHGASTAIPDWVLLPKNTTISVIVSAMNEAQTIGTVLDQLLRLPINEIIVVINGSNDRTKEIAEHKAKTQIVHFHQPLGHDVGRAVGSYRASGRILLYTDADMVILAEHFVPLIVPIMEGQDIALNDLTPFVGDFANRDEVTVMKEFLNRVAGREDLRMNSLTAIPHVLSRKAVDQIGIDHLAVPPKAHMMAIQCGLQIIAPWSIDVIRTNRKRMSNSGQTNQVSEMIIGDHLEALNMLFVKYGSRLHYYDHMRRRHYL